jgi:DNA-binding NtrC family response regulator
MLMQLTTVRFLASEAMRPRILVVDVDTLICELLGLVLEEDYQVTSASTSHAALQVLAEKSFDVILLDYHLRPGGVVELVKRADEIGIPMAWMTGDHTLAETLSPPVLLKPFHIDRVSEVLTEVRTIACQIVEPHGQSVAKPPAAQLAAARLSPKKGV